MVAPAAGAVVLVTFPFSDLSRAKLRPAVVLAGTGQDDWILSQITSNSYSDSQAVTITEDSFAQGSLQRRSYARPGKLFTANRQLMVRQVGTLNVEALREIVDRIVEILRSKLNAQDDES